MDLDQDMIKGNLNKSVLLRKSTIYVSVHMDVNKNYKIYENTFSVATTRLYTLPYSISDLKGLKGRVRFTFTLQPLGGTRGQI